VEGENCVATEEVDTTGHGSRVFDIVQASAPRSTFSFYRTIVKDPDSGKGVAKRSNVVDAIYEASQRGVDILNISLGVCHSEEEGHDCGELCRIADEARLAVEEDGVTIVAATGNDWNADAVACPALVTDVIGVGGYISICENDIDYSGESSQYWVNSDQMYGPFCGHRGCFSGPCEKHCKEEPWGNNVSFHNAVPNILAPVARVAEDSDGLSLEAGTSFATPLIAGRLATVVSDLILEEGKDPDPGDLRRGLQLTGAELDEGHMTKYNEQKLFQHLEGL
jgi:subtilase family serine protease